MLVTISRYLAVLLLNNQIKKLLLFIFKNKTLNIKLFFHLKRVIYKIIWTHMLIAIIFWLKHSAQFYTLSFFHIIFLTTLLFKYETVQNCSLHSSQMKTRLRLNCKVFGSLPGEIRGKSYKSWVVVKKYFLYCHLAFRIQLSLSILQPVYNALESRETCTFSLFWKGVFVRPLPTLFRRRCRFYFYGRDF